MINHPYLIALALIEQEGRRSLPLGGKSLIKAIDPNKNPGEEGSMIIQQLLLRIFQKTESMPLSRAYGDKSLLIIQIAMTSMQEHIPIIKANWINSGDSAKLIEDLVSICEGVWSLNFSREQGIYFSNLT